MRLLFAGTPAIAVPCLDALVSAGHQVEVLSNADALAGRGGRLTPPPVKVRALELGVSVHQPERLDASVRDRFAGRYDLLVSFAYGKIFGPKFLALFPLGGVNVHPSLLPRWRGPSPLSATLLARDAKTGISVQRLALAMDAGDVLVRSELPLTGTETTGSLTEWAAHSSAPLLLEALEAVASQRPPLLVQNDDEATYCQLLTKEDGRLDWSRPALALDAQVRACDPWPGTFTSWKGERLALRQSSVRGAGSSQTPGTVVSVDKSDGILIQTGDGLLAVRELQLPARKALDFRSFLNGNPSLVGSCLGEPS